jgi:CDP-diacylglycerol---serine O-phosphatidyltransferase
MAASLRTISADLMAPLEASPASAFHAANLMTYLSLASGLAAVASALGGNSAAAGALLALAALADTFDGRFARLLRRKPDQQALGVQLDSLSDAVSFGVAPVVSMAVLLTRETGPVGIWWWSAATFYTACAVTRLAHFNVSREATEGFVGLPAPVAALIWSSILLMLPTPPVGAAIALVTGCAMVAPLRIPRPTGAGLVLFALWPVSLIAAHLSSLVY